jgi:hypothetical protein
MLKFHRNKNEEQPARPSGFFEREVMGTDGMNESAQRGGQEVCCQFSLGEPLKRNGSSQIVTQAIAVAYVTMRTNFI